MSQFQRNGWWKLLSAALTRPRLLARARDALVEELALLIGCGMSVSEALLTMERVIGSRSGRANIVIARRAVEDGAHLWEALERADMARDTTLAFVRAGEESGKLDANLLLAVSASDRRRRFNSAVLSAVLYPIVVVVIALAVGIGVMGFVLPKFTRLFEGMNATLPPLTQWFLTVGRFMAVYGTELALGIAVMIIFMSVLFFTFLPVRYALEKIILRLPVVGSLMREREVARWTVMIGMLLEAGFPLLDAVRAAGDSALLAVHRRFYGAVRAALEEGQSLSESIAQTTNAALIVPPSLAALIAVAEHAGALGKTLQTLGERTEARADVVAKNVSTLIEPVMLVVVWLFVLGISVAIILPIYGVLSVVR